MNRNTTQTSPFDDAPEITPDSSVQGKPGPGQFSLAAIALITFDLAFILGWWANSNSHTPFGELTNEYAQRVIGSTLRVGIIAYPLWTGVIAFLPALIGAALGTIAHPDVDHRRRIRAASLYWTVLSAMAIEWLIQWGMLIVNFDSDAKLLFFAFGNLGWGGLVLIIFLAWVAMIAAGYGLIISLILSLLGRWKMIPLSAPWQDVPWQAMWNIGLYGPYVWLEGFLIWELAGMPELLAI